MVWTFRKMAVGNAALFLLFVSLCSSRAAAQTSFPSSNFSTLATLSLDSRPDAPVAKLKPDQPSPTDFREIPEEGIYIPMDATQRLKWFVAQTAGPESFLAGMFSAGIGTARGKP